MSLIEEMRPSLEEVEKRRWGTRTYDPTYVLDTHLQLPNIEEARAGGHYKSLNRPKVKPVFVQPNGDHVYQTSHGELNTDTREKFSNAWLWTTTNKATYKDWIPVIKPPDYGSRVFLPHADLVGISIRPLRFDMEAHEWQEHSTGGLLEDKVWPKREQITFPHNAYPGHRRTRTRYDARERSQEEKNKLKEHIRDLIKCNSLNPQYICPFVHFGGHESKEARTYEPLERPPTRNPASMQSVTYTIHRYDARERSQEEKNKLKEHIRDLIKCNSLNPQYICPFVHFGGHESKEARTYEPLERPPTRNPASMQSVTYTIHRYDARERSQEEKNKLKEHIRDLIKCNSLNPQYICPFVHFGGHESKEARTYEPLERPPTRNPASMQSVTYTIHRPLPQKEYKLPEYAMRTPFARMITSVSPNNAFCNERKSEKIRKI